MDRALVPPLSSKPRVRLLAPLVTLLLGAAALCSACAFVTPGLRGASAPSHRAVHAEAKQGPSLSSTVAMDAPVSGHAGLWAFALACTAGAAAAITGATSLQASSKHTTRSRVALRAGPTSLDQLRKQTVVVADTGVLEDIKKFKPQDATTNPTLVLRALSGPDAKSYFDHAIAWAASSEKDVKMGSEELVTDISDRLAVLLGCEILKIVPGVVSTEVDARLSFDTEAMIAKGRKLSKLYQEQGYGKDRVLIKLASTWEAMVACKQLESEGIHTNMTLVLSLPQAVAAAEAGATLISPFVGRILDWYKKAQKRDFTPEEDPGVLSVRHIFAYYKKFGYDTIVMGASFRSAPEVLALAGCDKMTIAPALLEDLENLHVEVKRRLDPTAPVDESIQHLEEGGLSEGGFRWHLNEDPMATELLSSGIRAFGVDGAKLEDLVRTRLGESPPGWAQ